MSNREHSRPFRLTEKRKNEKFTSVVIHEVLIILEKEDFITDYSSNKFSWSTTSYEEFDRFVYVKI